MFCFSFFLGIRDLFTLSRCLTEDVIDEVRGKQHRHPPEHSGDGKEATNCRAVNMPITVHSDTIHSLWTERHPEMFKYIKR